MDEFLSRLMASHYLKVASYLKGTNFCGYLISRVERTAFRGY